VSDHDHALEIASNSPAAPSPRPRSRQPRITQAFSKWSSCRLRLRRPKGHFLDRSRWIDSDRKTPPPCILNGCSRSEFGVAGCMALTELVALPTSGQLCFMHVRQTNLLLSHSPASGGGRTVTVQLATALVHEKMQLTARSVVWGNVAVWWAAEMAIDLCGWLRYFRQTMATVKLAIILPRKRAR
jgi:hypothetical protein